MNDDRPPPAVIDEPPVGSVVEDPRGRRWQSRLTSLLSADRVVWFEQGASAGLRWKQLRDSYSPLYLREVPMGDEPTLADRLEEAADYGAGPWPRELMADAAEALREQDNFLVRLDALESEVNDLRAQMTEVGRKHGGLTVWHPSRRKNTNG